LGNEGIAQATVGVLLGFDGGFELVTKGHEFVDFGDDAMLYGKGW
jgi:hypothetical protein